MGRTEGRKEKEKGPGNKTESERIKLITQGTGRMVLGREKGAEGSSWLYSSWVNQSE